MGTAESVAVVQLIAYVRDVGAGEANGEVLAEGLTHREIEGGVAGQMVGAIAIEKAGAVVDGKGCEAMPRQVALDAGRERVALIVVQVKTAFGWRRKVRESARDSAEALCLLVRIHQVSVIVTQNQRRADRNFDAPDAGRVDGER